MHDYRTILFDLDGTITDSAPGVMNAFHHALNAFGIEPKTHGELKKVVGPPLHFSFAGYGVPEERIGEIMEHYLSYYLPRGIYENSVFPGMEELFRRLKGAGKRLVVASSKRQDGVDTVMRYFTLDQYFDFAAGSDESVGRVTKADTIRYILDTLDISDIGSAILVGDRKYDVEGALPFGLETVGILHGYGTEEELRKAGAAFVVKDAWELMDFFGV